MSVSFLGGVKGFEQIRFPRVRSKMCVEIKAKPRMHAKCKRSTPAGLEPTRDKPNRFLVDRLNRSATVSSYFT